MDNHAPAVFADFLDPVESDAFFSDYWEQMPLHISRSNPDTFSNIVSRSAIEDILSTQSLKFPQVQLSKSGTHIPTEDYTDVDGMIVAGRLAEHFHSGATIVMSQAQRMHPPLMELCRRFQFAMNMNCQTNLYLSPGGQQGFNPHYDTHDVFILQVAGSKTFNFYENHAPFPTADNRYNSTHFDIGDKTQETELTAGDTLYIPRGFTHDAVAHPDEPSLHITLGAYPILVNTLVEHCIAMAANENVSLRRAVPSINPDIEKLSSELQQMIVDSLQPDKINATLQHLLDTMAIDATTSIRGKLVFGGGTVSCGLDTQLSVDSDHLMSVSEEGRTLKLRSLGNVHVVEPPYTSAALWLLEKQQCHVKDLPDLNDEQKLALGGQLLNAGIVKISDNI